MLGYHTVIVNDFFVHVVVLATLETNVSIVCPNDAITYTCIVTGDTLQWSLIAPTMVVISAPVLSFTPIDVPQIVGMEQGFLFERVRTVANSGSLRSTLTTITDISLLRGSMVTCTGENQTLGPLTVQVAGILLIYKHYVNYNMIDYDHL